MVRLVLDMLFEVPMKSKVDMFTRQLYMLILTSRIRFRLEIIGSRLFSLYMIFEIMLVNKIT